MRGSRITAAVIAALFTGSTLLLGGCAGGSGDASDTSSAAAETAPAGDAARAAGSLTAQSGDTSLASKDTAGVNGANQTSPLSGVTVEREVIATAEVTMRSDDVDTSVDDVSSIADAAGGFVSARDVQNNPDDPDRTRATITVRVPTHRLDTVIDDISAEGELVRVVSDEQDVTQTVVDVNSRVRSAQASVERIRVLLSQANTIGAVVRIESELARREADLESLQAQQRALADQTAMATLSVTVLAPEAAGAVPGPPEDEDGFVGGLQRGWDALVDASVVALTIVGAVLPFAVVGALVALPFVAVWRRRRPPATHNA